MYFWIHKGDVADRQLKILIRNKYSPGKCPGILCMYYFLIKITSSLLFINGLVISTTKLTIFLIVNQKPYKFLKCWVISSALAKRIRDFCVCRIIKESYPEPDSFL
jgi:hypothetical protein